MFKSIALDVVIGLVFIFLLYSMLATIIQEIIATKLAFRSKILQKAILRMLEDGKTTTFSPFFDVLKGFYQLMFRTDTLKGKRFATAFYTHPLIKYLTEDNWFSKPAYLDAKNFSKVIIDLLHGIEPNLQGYNILKIKDSVDSGLLKDNLKTNDPANPANKAYKEENKISNSKEIIDINPETQLFLQSLLTESQGDVEKLKVLLEKWFDDTMDRATGWYKRYTQYILLIIGFVLAVAFNVDSIAIYKILSKDKPARDQLVQMAIASKDKFKSEVDRQRKNEQGEVTLSSPESDSLLKETYKMVVEDANTSNQVMGLGRPWKDTCTMCGNFNSDSTQLRFKFLAPKKDSFNLILAASVINDTNIAIKKRLPNIKKSPRDSVSLESLMGIKKTNDSFLLIYKPAAMEYDSLNTLGKRCVYIKKEIGDKWFKYSPNQTGDEETFLGWLITALAISLGAPFWYDLLSKIINIRGAGRKSGSSDGSGNSTTTPNAPSPVTVNVNSNSGEEAVG